MNSHPPASSPSPAKGIPYDLGLDCGTNSLGWACVCWEPASQSALNPEWLGSGEVIAAGARVFPEATEKKTGALKNLARRQKRSMRKNLRQRRWRRDHLTALLVEWGWMPLPPVEPDAKSAFHHALSDGIDPYQLRAEGLQRKLTLAEFARVLLHMVKRRGFQSNRKIKGADDGKVLSAIKRVAEEIEKAGAPTLGAFLHQRRQADGALPVRNRAYLSDEVKAATVKGKKKEEGDPPADGPYALFTRRAMYDQELHLLWQVQQLHHGDALNTERLKLVQRFVLEQRPLKVQRHLVGECPHVPGQKRAPIAYLQAQEARILATLNTLRVMNPDVNARRDQASRELTQGERQKLLEVLMDSKEMEWDRARRVLGLHNGEKFNIEYGGRTKKLKGNTTLTALRKALPAPKKAGKGKKAEPAVAAGPLSWDDLHDEEQHAIIKTLVYEDHEGRATAYICKHSRLDRETARRLAEEVSLEDGHFAFSVEALEKILPHLREYQPGRVNKRGRLAPMQGMTEAIESAGFSHLKKYDVVPQLPLPPDLRNPVVNKALYQVRKVVNALIRRHGLPRRIRIELARDMKRTEKEREEYDLEMAKRDKRRATMRPEINRLLKRSEDVEPKPEEYLRFELWEECGKTCPYSLRVIGCEQVYSAEVQIEHIIPWSRCFDDSRGNKTLCYWRHNQCKGRLTPREAFAEANPAHFEQMCQHMRHCVEKGTMKRGKAARFEWTNVEQEAGGDEFTNRHLSDTRYLSRAIHDFLKQLNPDPDTVFVQVAKGDTTAVLRHYWGLNDSAGTPAAGCILPPFTSPTAVGSKNRDDHRHHAVDAIVIALTSPSILQFLSRLSGQQGRDALYDGRLHLPPPWHGFRESVRQRIAGITVSHDPTRKAKGALHKETAYGATDKPGEYVYRVKLQDLTVKDLDPVKGCVRDRAVGDILRSHLALHGGNPKAAFAQPVFHKDGKTRIRNVRVTVAMNNSRGLKRAGEEEPFRYHGLGSNHHVVILHNLETNKWEERIVSLMEAAERVSSGKPVVQVHWGAGFSVEMLLQVNDMFELNEEGGRGIYRVQKLSSGDYNFRRHNVSRIDGDMEEVGRLRLRSMKALQELNPRMVDVTPLGDILPRG